MAQAQWYDPANDTYSPDLHRKFHSLGQRVLAWDTDFNCDMAAMAEARLDGVVTDRLAETVRRKRDVARQIQAF